MLKKENTLKKNYEFQQVLNKKRQFVNKFLILYYMPYNKAQIGISIPKKFANAVKRNHLRNQIRNIVGKIDLSKYKYRLVIIIRKDYINLSFDEKKQIINSIIGKLKLNG